MASDNERLQAHGDAENGELDASAEELAAWENEGGATVQSEKPRTRRRSPLGRGPG